MIEDRKRSIIRHQPEPGPGPHSQFEPEQELEYIPHESLLEKRVYLPLPVILLGFLTIILVSISLTYVVVMWPSAELVFPENRELARFEAAANPGVLPKKAYRPERPLALDAPPDSLYLPPLDTGRRYAGLEQSAADASLVRDFSPRTASPAGIPVADLEPASRRAETPKARTTALRLDTLGEGELPRAAGIEAPVFDPALSPRRQPAPGVLDTPFTLDAPGERNFIRPAEIKNPVSQLRPEARKADAATNQSQAELLDWGGGPQAAQVGRPEVDNAANPLLKTAAGENLPVRNFSLGKATGVSGPVAEITLKAGPAPDGGSLKAAALETKRFSGQSAFSPGELIADVRPTGRPLNIPPNLTEANGATPREHAFTAALELDDPVALMGLAEHGVGYPEKFRDGAALETKNTSLTAAMGLDQPVALLNLPVRSAAGNFSSLDVPEQMQPPRRYARAVITPERMDPIPPPLPAAREAVPESGQDVPPWRRYAAAVPEAIEGKGRIVIIIDDMGNKPGMARKFGELDGPLNFAFLPYAPNLKSQTSAMRAEGHELLVHLPMEPSGNENPGPHALLTSLTNQQVLETIDWNLTRFEGFVGVNNHMGSRFTKDAARMRLVMEELHRRGLLFLDSRTVPNSEGARWAKRLGMPWAGRDVFLDNVIDEAAILAQLKKVEVIAKRRGLAIAIGHPHGVTLDALKKWLPTLEANGLVLVPLSSVVEEEDLPKLASAKPE